MSAFGERSTTANLLRVMPALNVTTDEIDGISPCSVQSSMRCKPDQVS